jgi:alpha-tubulin suppressor-like RCC1 family protein
MSCAGQNWYGALGDGSGATQLTPVVLFPNRTVQSMSAGTYSSCAILTDQTIWCWGENTHEQLGDGTTIGRFKPVQVQP